MAFDFVILCASSYSYDSIAFLSKKYFAKGEMKWYYILISARWLKLCKQAKYTKVFTWKKVVEMFRLANKYSKLEDSK